MLKLFKRPICVIILGLTLGIAIGSLSTYIILTKLMEGKGMAIWALGTEFFEKGEYDRAIAVLNQGIALYPDFDLLHSTLAEAYEAKGNFDLALTEYQESLNLNVKYGRKNGHVNYLKIKLEKLKEILERDEGP